MYSSFREEQSMGWPRFTTALISALALAVGWAGAAAALQVKSMAPATQLASTQFVLHSDKVGRDFLVKVTEPFSPIPKGELRPAIYALDGGYEIAGPMAWVLGGAGGMAQAFVVSVGYLPPDYHWREQDLTFPRAGQPPAGPDGGPAFRAFLNDELRPFIRRRYPVNEAQAVLFGHSLGGAFATHVLAAAPDEYAGYLIASPSVWSDPGIVERLTANIGRTHARRIYLAVGGAETPRMLEGHRALAAALKAAPPAVQVTDRIYAGATHLSYYPALIAEAFPWLLPPSPAP
jgi:predicted alpha/beta superfamily hydrolase